MAQRFHNEGRARQQDDNTGARQQDDNTLSELSKMVHSLRESYEKLTREKRDGAGRWRDR